MDQRSQVLTFEKLHRVVPEAVLGHTIVEHPDRIEMPQLACCVYLPFETSDRSLRRVAPLELRAKDLDGDISFQRLIVSSPDLTHATFAEASFETVPADVS